MSQTLSTLGTPGLIDMPTAEVLEDGAVALTTNRYGNISRNTFAFQVLPRVYGSFRYSLSREFFSSTARVSSTTLFDRSFDLHYQIGFESQWSPGFAVGLRDFGGTGVLSGEYLVATKGFGDRFRATAGLGWGRLAQRGGFSNPLGVFAQRFESRPTGNSGGITTGQLDFGDWFRGDAAVFAGLEYQASERLSLQFEYSTDQYNREVQQGIIEIDTPINVGLNYTYPSGSSIRAFFIGGTEVGLQYSYVFNPKRRRSIGGLDKAPLPIPDSRDAILAQMSLSDRNALRQARETLSALLEDEGISLEGFRVDGARATVRIQNNRWDIEAQAIGRTGRVMGNVLPGNISTFVIIPQNFGVPNSAITLQRADLEELQNDFDGAWKSLARSRINDASEPQSRADEVDGLYPRFSYGLGPYLSFSFFDPDEPVRFESGPELSVSYSPLPGFSLNGLFRYPVLSTVDDATRRSNSVLPRVRSDSVLYAIESDFEINRLTAEYMFRPGENLFGRVTGGYLENQFAGISGEVLWYPVDSRLALGLEINYARQREFDMLFGLQDYEIVTGHASGYYDFQNGFLAQVDAGRYLAGDWGATFGLDREFNNGFKIGGYFTLTDVSFDDFGEGSFDKGIRFTIPLSWLTGQPSRSTYSQTIQPVLRDGGARLSVANRLYGVTRDYRAQNLSDGWGRVFR